MNLGLFTATSGAYHFLPEISGGVSIRRRVFPFPSDQVPRDVVSRER